MNDAAIYRALPVYNLASTGTPATPESIQKSRMRGNAAGTAVVKHHRCSMKSSELRKLPPRCDVSHAVVAPHKRSSLPALNQ